jgi:hypothetical protein
MQINFKTITGIAAVLTALLAGLGIINPTQATVVGTALLGVTRVFNSDTTGTTN